MDIRSLEKKKVIEFPTQVDDNPVVSVIVLAYNHGPYIEECLQSILNQVTEFKFEIIVGEDDSKDETRSICIEYANKFPDKIRLLLHHRENNIYVDGKPTGRFNFLYNVHSARGKYIALCDGDDYWTDPLKLQKQVDFLESNPQYVLLGGYSKKVYETEDYRVLHDESEYTEDFDFDTGFLFLENPLSTLTVCFRNGLIRQFPDVYFKSSGGDRRLYMLLSQYGKCRYMHKSWGVYRRHGGGATNLYRNSWTGKLKVFRESIVNANNWNRYFENKYEAEVKLVQHRAALGAIKLCVQNKSFRQAAQFLNFIDANKLTVKSKILCVFLRFFRKPVTTNA